MATSALYFLPRGVGGSAPGIGPPPRGVRRWISADNSIDGSVRAGDYVVLSGGIKQDDGFTSKVVLAWRTRLGSMQVDPTFGSRLHEVRHADERGRRLAEAYGLLAIQHLANEIQSLKVTATIPKKGQIYLVASGRKGMQTVSASYTKML